MFLDLFYRFAPCWVLNSLFALKSSKLDRRRIREIDKWLACAEDVARITRHSEARTLCSFIRENMYHVAPTAGGFHAIRATSRMRLPITVLLPEDKMIGGIWEDQLDMSDGSLANFVKGDGRFAVLSLKGFLSTSDLAKGILFLHEGKHAWHHYNKPAKSDAERSEEELSVLEFECRIIELYFGQEYSQFLGSEADRIAGLSSVSKGCLDGEWFAQAIERFQARFHSPANVVEDRLLSSNVTYALAFRYFDRVSLQARAEKIRFVEMLAESAKKLHLS